MSDERTRILDKIQKCLRLSKSSEPHEAAAALRQAQKMMALHNVSEADVAGAAYGSATNDTVVPARKKLPVVLNALVDLIERAFGVSVVLERYWAAGPSQTRYRVRYWGPPGRAQLASYAHDVVWRAMNTAYASAFRENPALATSRNARLNFRLEWLRAVRTTVEALGMSEEEKVGVELVKTQHYGKELVEAKVNTSARHCSEARALGRKAAEGFSLHRPMEGETQRKLGR